MSASGAKSAFTEEARRARLSAGAPPVYVAAPALTVFCEAVLRKWGCSEAESKETARHLVDCNLKGVDSHGVQMLSVYACGVASGRMKGNLGVTFRTHGENGVVIADAFKHNPTTQQKQHAFGVHAFRTALDRAIARIKDHGQAVCMVSFRQSAHMGRIGYYGEYLLSHRLAGVFFVNVTDHDATVTLHGAKDGLVNTNPMCIALPSACNTRTGDFLLDFATSKVAYGKVRAMMFRGETAPPGLFLDHKGKPSRDPTDMVASPRGALLPFGEHKGSGLSVATELLAGAVTGGRTMHPSNTRYCTPEDQSCTNSCLAIVFDPARVGGDTAEVGLFLQYLRAAAPYAEGTPVIAPGDAERTMFATRSAKGIPIPRPTMDALNTLAESLSIAPCEVKARDPRARL